MNTDPKYDVTGTIESISNVHGMITMKLVGDGSIYLMPGEVTVVLHREQSHYMAVMAMEAVAHPDGPDNGGKE